jgi:predicted DCC family thiol-disulfide oxidoreductase YuxK
MPATVIYDGDCSLCTRIRTTMEALDWFRTMRWIRLQDPEAAGFGISRQELEQSVYLVTESSRTHGWAAVKRMLLRVPVTYLLAAAAINRSPWSGIAIAVLFSPLADPAGERAYQWVARNRFRIAGSTCGTPNLG